MGWKATIALWETEVPELNGKQKQSDLAWKRKIRYIKNVKKNIDTNKNNKQHTLLPSPPIYPLALLFKRNVRLVTGELIGWRAGAWWHGIFLSGVVVVMESTFNIVQKERTEIYGPECSSCLLSCSSSSSRTTVLNRNAAGQSHYQCFMMTRGLCCSM